VTAAHLASIGEADGASSAAGGDIESEKGLDVIRSVCAADLGPVGWRIVGVRVGFSDYDSDCRAEDLSLRSYV